MKKASLQTIVDFFNTVTAFDVPEVVKDAVDEMRVELAKGQVKAEANRNAYADMRKEVIKAIASAKVPVTASEIAVSTGLPRAKIVWGLTHAWADEVMRFDGAPNTYILKG